MEKSIGTLQNVLQRTASYAENEVAQGKPYGVKILELRLIQSKEDIENPPTSIKAVRLVWVILVHLEWSVLILYSWKY